MSFAKFGLVDLKHEDCSVANEVSYRISRDQVLTSNTYTASITIVATTIICAVSIYLLDAESLQVIDGGML